jgi:hypothetical protein
MYQLLRDAFAMAAVAGCASLAACGAPAAGYGAPTPGDAGASPASKTSALVECTDGPDGLPSTLACTGLWGDPNVVGFNVFYQPGMSMWADGAQVARFIHLPDGTKIDTSDMDHWVFPVGTKLWQAMSLGGRQIETRYEVKRADGTWGRTTYVWASDDPASATDGSVPDEPGNATAVTGGISNLAGTGYEVPRQSQCDLCHRGAPDGVLGFEAIGLSVGQTPNVGMSMDALVQAGWLSAPPSAPLAVPGTPTEAAALGWLHANCGNACHNQSQGALAGSTGLWMRLSTAQLGSVRDTDAFSTAVGVASAFQPSGHQDFLLIKPGDSGHSAIPYRAKARDDVSGPGVQMPPIGTHVPDVAGVAALDAWIDAMPATAP